MNAFSNEAELPETTDSITARAQVIAPANLHAFKSLLVKTEEHFDTFCIDEFRIQSSRTECLYGMLSKVYELHLAGRKSPGEYSAFLKERGVKAHAGAGSEFHLTVKALVRDPEDRKKLRQTISEYGQALAGLEQAEVKPDEAVAWFSVPVAFGKVTLSGVQKAIATFKSSSAADSSGSTAHNSDALVAALAVEGDRTPIAETGPVPASAGLDGGLAAALIHVQADGRIAVLRLLTGAPEQVARLVKRFPA